MAQLCRSFNIPRSTYYYRAKSDCNKPKSKLYSGTPVHTQNGEQISEKKVVKLIKKYTNRYPYFGYRMITDYLRYHEKLVINHKRVYRIMKVLELLQPKIRPKPNNYRKCQKHKLDGPDQMWQLDMTQWYMDYSGQWVYMFGIIDVYTREIVGYHLSLRCRTQEAIKAMEMALESMSHQM